MIKNGMIILALSLIFATLVLTCREAKPAETPGFFVSAQGENKVALEDAKACIVESIEASSPLRLSDFSKSILDISVIEAASAEDHVISVVVSPPGYPFLHAVTMAPGPIEDSFELSKTMCMMVIQHVDTVITSIKERNKK